MASHHFWYVIVRFIKLATQRLCAQRIWIADIRRVALGLSHDIGRVTPTFANAAVRNRRRHRIVKRFAELRPHRDGHERPTVGTKHLHGEQNDPLRRKTRQRWLRLWFLLWRLLRLNVRRASGRHKSCQKRKRDQ